MMIFAILAAGLLSLHGTEMRAQWQVGVKAGTVVTAVDRSQAGRVDETYSAGTGWAAGVTGAISVTDWFAVRAELDLMDRTHRMDRNLPYLDPVYTIHHNTYAVLPVLADFSFGRNRLRGHMYAGAFAGYWLNAHRKGVTFWMTDYNVYFNDFNEKEEFTKEQRRAAAGLEAGAGLSCRLTPVCTLNLEAMYLYDLVSYTRSNPHIADPRYLDTIGISFGVSFDL